MICIFMHELSCTWDLCWDLILWMWIYIWNFILLDMVFKWKVFYIDLNFSRLTLGIGNLISSHSLSASHVPLGTGRDKYNFQNSYCTTECSTLFFKNLYCMTECNIVYCTTECSTLFFKNLYCTTECNMYCMTEYIIFSKFKLYDRVQYILW